MHKLFPHMHNSPDGGTPVVAISYWVVCYVLIPFVSTIAIAGYSQNIYALSWFDIITYGINFTAMLVLFRPHLADSFLTLEIHSRECIKTLLLCAGAMLLLSCGMLAAAHGFGLSISCFPVSETSVLLPSRYTVMTNPLFGTACMVLLTPLTVCCMFYAPVFAMLCVNHPKWAYPVMTLAMLVPRLFNGIWLGNWTYELGIYLCQLPIHLVACWSYQKTDCIWTPMAALSLTNLALSLVILLV